MVDYNIEKISLTKLAYSIEEDINDFAENCEYSMGGDEALVNTFESLLDSADFLTMNIIQDYGGIYWSGLLTAEPFDELMPIYGTEEGILNAIKEYNLRVVDAGIDGVVLEFFHNSSSPLYGFFEENRDGYGGNIPNSISAMMKKLIAFFKDKINEDPEDYGKVLPYQYCPTCDGWVATDEVTCYNCNSELFGSEEEYENSVVEELG